MHKIIVGIMWLTSAWELRWKNRTLPQKSHKCFLVVREGVNAHLKENTIMLLDGAPIFPSIFGLCQLLGEISDAFADKCATIFTS